MAASETEVANLALGHVGAPAIMDIDDRDNKSAREVTRVFDESARAVGAMANWNCLRTRAVAAQLSTGPIFGWQFQYQLPSDYLKLVSINDLDADVFDDYWDVEQLRLLTDADAANIRYVAHIKDVRKWSPGYTDCVALYMAQRFSTAIRQDRTKTAELKQEFYDRVLPDARKTYANEGRRRPINTTQGSQYNKARRVSTNG